MSWIHYVIVAAIALAIADLFVTSELTAISSILIAVVAVFGIDWPFFSWPTPYRELAVGVALLACIVAMLVAYWKVYRHLLLRLIDKRLNPTRMADSISRLVGTIGVIEEHGTRQFMRIEGELMPFSCTTSLSAGDRVRIIRFEDGIAIVLAT